MRSRSGTSAAPSMGTPSLARAATPAWRTLALACALLVPAFLSGCAATSSEQLEQAIVNNDVDRATSLFRQGAAPPARTPRGEVVLNRALQRRFERMARLLLAQGLDANVVDANGRPALAFISPRVNIEESPGVDRGLIPLLAYELTARQSCVAELSSETVELVLRNVANVDVEFPGSNEKPATALMQAAACGHGESLRLLLDRGADPSRATAEGTTAIAYGCAAARDNTVAMLLQRGANADAADRQGVTPLMLAARSGTPENLRVVELLLAHGVAVNAMDARGDTALSIAVRVRDQSAELVRALVKAGADPDAANKRGETARTLAGRRRTEFFGAPVDH